jgi:hypothetical protein
MKIADKLRLRPSLLTAAKVSACPPLCHPERSRGTCSAPFLLATVYQSSGRRFTLYPAICANYPELQPPAPW